MWCRRRLASPCSPAARRQCPTGSAPPLFDYLTGIYGAFAVLAALRERDSTGQAQMVDLAMLDVGLTAMASTMSTVLNAEREVRASGNTAASGASTSGIFETADGLLSMTGNHEVQVARLFGALGRPELLTDPRFATEADRKKHLAEFRALLQTCLLERSASEWEAVLVQARVPATRVRTIREALDEPHVKERAVVQTVTDARTGHTLQVPGIGFLWDGQAVGPRFGPPRLGEHTEEVLQGLGVKPPQLEALKAAGVI